MVTRSAKRNSVGYNGYPGTFRVFEEMMSRTERLLALIQKLRRHRRPVTGRELALEMSVSVRTVYRDLQTLIRQGAPIEGERGIGFILRPGFLLPPLMFRDEEIEALVLGVRWVAQQSDAALARAAQDALAKVTTVLPENLKERAEYAGLYPIPAEARVQDAVDPGALREAIRLERKMRILYRDEKGRESRRVVWPLALAFFERVRVLVAWCEMRSAFRHFRTDRIVAASITQEPLPRRRRMLLREWRSREGIPDGDI
jgi:predicted DNA-binding transcriptional regulator YafY